MSVHRAVRWGEHRRDTCIETRSVQVSCGCSSEQTRPLCAADGRWRGCHRAHTRGLAMSLLAEKPAKNRQCADVGWLDRGNFGRSHRAHGQQRTREPSTISTRPQLVSSIATLAGLRRRWLQRGAVPTEIQPDHSTPRFWGTPARQRKDLYGYLESRDKNSTVRRAASRAIRIHIGLFSNSHCT